MNSTQIRPIAWRLWSAEKRSCWMYCRDAIASILKNSQNLYRGSPHWQAAMWKIEQIEEQFDLTSIEKQQLDQLAKR